MERDLSNRSAAAPGGPRRRRARALGECVWALVMLGLALITGATARADGFIIVVPDEPPMPRPIHRPRPTFFPLSVRYHDVTVTVKDQVAVTEIDQVFHNPNPRDLEGTYIFPVPAEAAVSGLSLWMGGKEVEGELLDADKAREVYEGIVRKMQDPALLEYMGRGLMKARVFPIPANGDARVKLRYEQVLGAQGGLIEYRYPLNTEKFSAQPLERVKVELLLEGRIGNVFSPSHALRIEREGGKVRAVYEDKGVKPDRDLILYYRRPEGDKPLGLSLVTHKREGADHGTFMMLLTPEAAAEAPQPAKDVVFVLDRSGSMAGDKMEQAKAALRYCVRTLRADDRFQIVDFATGVKAWGERLVAATPEHVRSALAYIDEMKARGGTDIHGALTRALAMGSEGAARPLMVVFITDGEPTIGVTAPEKIEEEVKKAREARPDKANVRLFVFGVGSDLNAVLLDRLAEQNRGAREYAGERESVEVKVSSFFDKVSAPVLSDVTIAVEGLETDDHYPRPIPDLFFGAEMPVFGRYKGAGMKAIRVKGKLDGREVELVYEARFGDEASAPFIERAFAVRKVAFLLDQIRLNGEKKELKDEVVSLAKEFGIITPYTSYLVAEDAEIARAQGRAAEPAHGAFDHMRRRSAGFRADENDAREALTTPTGGSGGSGPPPAPSARPEAAGEKAARASESLRKLGDGSLGAPGEGGADAAKAPLTAEPAELVRGSLEERGRFAKDEKEAQAARDQAEEAAQALTEVVRMVGGRAFYRQGEVWVDSRLEAGRTLEQVEYLSDAYFALVKESKEAGQVLALGARVRFVAGKRAIEVTVK